LTTVTVDSDGVVADEHSRLGPAFWLRLGFGIAWILFSFLLLQFTYTSILSISIVVGAVLLFAAVTEFLEAFVAPSWQWVHAVVGLIFATGAVTTWAYPGQTFGTLALFFGWYLLIKGTTDVVLALTRHGTHLWWLELLIGVAQIALAFWAVGYTGRSATMLVLWVGLGAALHGFATLVAAFQLRDLDRAAI
jgi:uncharacterized membrane protein HdeD (DUF308 family)